MNIYYKTLSDAFDLYNNSKTEDRKLILNKYNYLIKVKPGSLISKIIETAEELNHDELTGFFSPANKENFLKATQFIKEFLKKIVASNKNIRGVEGLKLLVPLLRKAGTRFGNEPLANLLIELGVGSLSSDYKTLILEVLEDRQYKLLERLMIRIYPEENERTEKMSLLKRLQQKRQKEPFDASLYSLIVNLQSDSELKEFLNFYFELGVSIKTTERVSNTENEGVSLVFDALSQLAKQKDQVEIFVDLIKKGAKYQQGDTLWAIKHAIQGGKWDSVDFLASTLPFKSSVIQLFFAKVCFDKNERGKLGKRGDILESFYLALIRNAKPLPSQEDFTTWLGELDDKLPEYLDSLLVALEARKKTIGTFPI
jgi:hypothetical protein